MTRKEAKAKGLPRYFTGKPCLVGHVAERYTTRGTCLECDRLKTRKYYKANRRACIERVRASERKKRDEAARRPKPQECEICGSPDRIVFDHCHVSGSFRGWLCNGCNVALGHAKDNPDTLRKLAAYLEASQPDQGHHGQDHLHADAS